MRHTVSMIMQIGSTTRRQMQPKLHDHGRSLAATSTNARDDVVRYRDNYRTIGAAIPRLVMATGVSPGVGKSTLMTSLARTLRESGAIVDLFTEEQLFTRPDYARMAAGFRSRSFPTYEIFLTTYAAHISQLRTAGSWGLFDWNCAGMAGDLPWARENPAAVVDLVRAVRELAQGMAPIVLCLDAPIELAVRRAVAERGRDWVTKYAKIAADNGVGQAEPIDMIIRYLRAEDQARVDLETLESAGWETAKLDATGSAADVLSRARAVLHV